MANATDKQELFQQALVDAGCEKPFRELCCECYLAGDKNKLDQLLKDRRRTLLEAVHKGQEQIDCLDYLTFLLRKET